MSKRSEALELAERAALHFYQTDPEFVEGGCSDVSEVLVAWLQTRGYQAEAIYGSAKRGRTGTWFLHAWMKVEGRRFDPVLWVQERETAKYKYNENPSAAEALQCDVEFIIEGELEDLDKVFPLSE